MFDSVQEFRFLVNVAVRKEEHTTGFPARLSRGGTEHAFARSGTLVTPCPGPVPRAPDDVNFDGAPPCMLVLAVVIVLIAFNALYVAAEFGAVSVRRTQIQARAEGGSRSARFLLPVLSDPAKLDRYVAACQIGITISSLLLGAYGQSRIAAMVAPLFESMGGLQQAAAHTSATIAVLLLLTVLQMVLGELVPKSLSLQSPIRSALWTATPMRISLKVFAGFIWILNGTGLLVLRLFGMSAAEHRHQHSAAEIEALIEESSEGGVLPESTDEPLRQALRLGARPIGEIMTPREQIEAVDVRCGPEELMKKAADSPFTRIPVFDGSLDRVLGIAHAKSLTVHALGRPDAPALRDILLPLLDVRADLPATELLSRMRHEHRQTAIVRADDGSVAGLITVDDILHELLGGAPDEFKDTPEPAATAKEGAR